MSWPVLIAFLILRAGGGVSAFQGARAQASGATAPAMEDPLQPLSRKVFDLVNRQRRLHGLALLQWNDSLARQARLQSTSMMERGFFAHVDPVRGPLALRLNAAGIHWSRCGENIFREYGMDEPAEEAVEGWMKSPAHRMSVLDPLFSETGVGIAISPTTEYYVTQIFIRPRQSAVP